jgi:hypothetical protein
MSTSTAETWTETMAMQWAEETARWDVETETETVRVDTETRTESAWTEIGRADTAATRMSSRASVDG